MELKQPSKSVDFHCGAKDTASEIMLALGELAGAAKSAGLREVLAAGSGNSNVQKKGVMLFDFMAQGDDEVTVGLGDEILVLDDSASDEWWKVRRLKNGKEGVVPANYVEVTETVPIHAPAAAIARSGTNAGRSVVEQNRREEEELARQAARRKKPESEARNDQVGPGLHLPSRNSSLMQTNVDHRRTSQRSSKRESSAKDSSSKSGSKPSQYTAISLLEFLDLSTEKGSAPFVGAEHLPSGTTEHVLCTRMLTKFVRFRQGTHLDRPIRIVQGRGRVHSHQGWQDPPTQSQWRQDRCTCHKDVSRRPRVRRTRHRRVSR